jgi:hypothetical protein
MSAACPANMIHAGSNVLCRTEIRFHSRNRAALLMRSSDGIHFTVDGGTVWRTGFKRSSVPVGRCHMPASEVEMASKWCRRSPSPGPGLRPRAP